MPWSWRPARAPRNSKRSPEKRGRDRSSPSKASPVSPSPSPWASGPCTRWTSSIANSPALLAPPVPPIAERRFVMRHGKSERSSDLAVIREERQTTPTPIDRPMRPLTGRPNFVSSPLQGPVDFPGRNGPLTGIRMTNLRYSEAAESRRTQNTFLLGARRDLRKMHCKIASINVKISNAVERMKAT